MLFTQPLDVLEELAKDVADRHFRDAKETPKTNRGTAELKESAATTGWIGNPKTSLPEARAYTPDELVKELGFKLVEYDPEYVRMASLMITKT